MNQKRATAVIAFIIVLFIAYYFVSPFIFMRSLAQAANASDRDALALDVDFPAVRDGLKSQFNAMIAGIVAKDASSRRGQLAGLVTMLAPITVNRLVDAIVTPDNIAILLRRNVSDQSGSGGAPSLWRGRFSWIDLDHLRASYVNARHPNEPFAIVLERRGIFSWKVASLELPLNDIADSASN